MIFNKTDIATLRSALLACKLADIENVVIHQGLIRGISEKETAIIFSNISFSFGDEVSFGITRISDLEKRLNLFTDDMSVEGEVSKNNEMRKLTFKQGRSKIEFRCASFKLIRYPKTMSDEDNGMMTISKDEVSFISRGVKTMNPESLSISIKNGEVIFECSDASNDVFNTSLSNDCELENDGYFNSFAVGSSGVIIPLMESASKSGDVSLLVKKSGILSINVANHTVLIPPVIS